VQLSPCNRRGLPVVIEVSGFGAAEACCELAVRTGGTSFTVTAGRGLEQILGDIEAELTGQYSIGFTRPAVRGNIEKCLFERRETGLWFIPAMATSRDS
jgi:hypothetical protein